LLLPSLAVGDDANSGKTGQQVFAAAGAGAITVQRLQRSTEARA